MSLLELGTDSITVSSRNGQRSTQMCSQGERVTHAHMMHFTDEDEEGQCRRASTRHGASNMPKALPTAETEAGDTFVLPALRRHHSTVALTLNL